MAIRAAELEIVVTANTSGAAASLGALDRALARGEALTAGSRRREDSWFDKRDQRQADWVARQAYYAERDAFRDQQRQFREAAWWEKRDARNADFETRRDARAEAFSQREASRQARESFWHQQRTARTEDFYAKQAARDEERARRRDADAGRDNDYMRVVAGYGSQNLGSRLIGFAADFVSEGAKFEQQLVFIDRLAGGAGERVEDLGQKIYQVDQNAIYGSQQIAEAMTQLAREGANADQIIGDLGKNNGWIDAAINAAAAMDEGVIPTANAYGTVMRVFKDANLDAAETSDILAQAVLRSGRPLAEFMTGFQYVGGVAAELGVPFRDLATAMSLLGAEGVKVRSAGTGLRTLFLELADPEVAAQLQDLGIRAAFVDGQFQGLPQIIEDFGKALAGMGDDEALAFLEDIFGKNAASPLLTLFRGGLEAYTEHQENMESLGSAASVMDARMDTLAGSIDRFGAAMDRVKQVLGGASEWFVRPFLELGTLILNAFINAPPIVHALAAALVLVVGAVASMAGALLIFNAIGGFGAVTTAMGILGGVAVGFVATLGLVAAAIGVLGVAWEKNVWGVQDKVTGAFEKIGAVLDVFGHIWRRIDNAFREGSSVETLLKGLPEWAQPAASAIFTIADAVGDLWRRIDAGDWSGFFNALGEKAQEIASQGIKLTVAVVGLTLNLAEDLIGSGYEWLKRQLFGSYVAGDGTGGPEATTGIAISVGDVAVKVGTLVVQAIAGWADSAATTIQTWIDGHPPGDFTTAINLTGISAITNEIDQENWAGAVKAVWDFDPVDITPEIELNIKEGVEDWVRDLDAPDFDAHWLAAAPLILGNFPLVLGAWATKNLVPDIGRVLRGVITGVLDGVFTDETVSMPNPFGEGREIVVAQGFGNRLSDSILGWFQEQADKITQGIEGMSNPFAGWDDKITGWLSSEFDAVKGWLSSQVPDWMRLLADGDVMGAIRAISGGGGSSLSTGVDARQFSPPVTQPLVTFPWESPNYGNRFTPSPSSNPWMAPGVSESDQVALVTTLPAVGAGPGASRSALVPPDVGPAWDQLQKRIELVVNAIARVATVGFADTRRSVDLITTDLVRRVENEWIGLRTSLTALTNGAARAVENAWVGLRTNLVVISTGARNQVANVFVGVRGDLAALAGAAANAVVNAFVGMRNDAVQVAFSMRNGVANEVIGLRDDLWTLGVNAGASFAAGISTQVVAAMAAGMALAQSAKAGTALGLLAASPSRAFRELGNWAYQGFVLGIDDGRRPAHAAGAGLAGAAAGGVSGLRGGGSTGVTYVDNRTFLTPSPADFQRLLQMAEKGGRWAEQAPAVLARMTRRDRMDQTR